MRVGCRYKKCGVVFCLFVTLRVWHLEWDWTAFVSPFIGRISFCFQRFFRTTELHLSTIHLSVNFTVRLQRNSTPYIIKFSCKVLFHSGKTHNTEQKSKQKAGFHIQRTAQCHSQRDKPEPEKLSLKTNGLLPSEYHKNKQYICYIKTTTTILRPLQPGWGDTRNEQTS